LALWQSEHVADRLRQADPGLHVELVPMSTRGDEVLDRSLALWQSEHVADRLRQADPGLHVELVPMSTRGD
ncbi:hypothetical protein C7E18_24295, partial [Stenotrophomonas maltophilia]